MNKKQLAVFVIVVIIISGYFLLTRDSEIDIIDTDENGVWDYVDGYIDLMYPSIEEEGVRSAARQFSRAIQGGILNANNKELSIQFAIDSDRATECMFHLREDDGDAYDVLSGLEAAILNDESKSIAFLTWSEQSAGEVFSTTSSPQRSLSCDSK